VGKDKVEQAKGKTSDPLRQAVAANISNLYSVLNSTDRYLFGSVNVVRRNHDDWLALCKVTELDSMVKLIAFGAGADYFAALKGLNASISAGKWKVDKPWIGKGK
jgi:hypothetical protein